MMADPLDGLNERLAQLKGAFDEAFALPASAPLDNRRSFLLVGVNGQSYAIRISDLATLEADRKIEPIPMNSPWLLGIAALQGQLVPVFDLGTILGAGTKQGAPRWIVLLRNKELLALAFGELHGSLSVAQQDMHDMEAPSEQAGMSREAIQVDNRLIHVLDMETIISNIRRMMHRS